MKYVAPTIIKQRSALTAILGVKGTIGQDSNPLDARSDSSAYESDE